MSPHASHSQSPPVKYRNTPEGLTEAYYSMFDNPDDLARDVADTLGLFTEDDAEDAPAPGWLLKIAVRVFEENDEEWYQ